MSLPANLLKAKLNKGQKVLATWSMLSSSNVCEAIATTGLDAVIIDMEHGSMSFETVEDCVRACQLRSVQPIVRICDAAESTMLRALETGARAIFVPHIENIQDAKKVASACRYYPKGTRGLSPYTRNHDFSHDDLKNSLQKANEETLVGILVEGKDGLASLADISAIAEIDLIYLGIYDISQAVGRPGDLEHEEVLDAVRNCVSVIHNAGKKAGSFAKDLAYARILAEAGFDFIALGADSAALRSYYLNAQEELRFND